MILLQASLRLSIDILHYQEGLYFNGMQIYDLQENRISFDSEIRLKLKSKTFPIELNFPDSSNLNIPMYLNVHWTVKVKIVIAFETLNLF